MLNEIKLPIVSEREVLMDTNRTLAFNAKLISQDKLVKELCLSPIGRAHLKSLGFEFQKTVKGYVVSKKPENYNQLTMANLEVPHANNDREAYNALVREHNVHHRSVPKRSDVRSMFIPVEKAAVSFAQ